MRDALKGLHFFTRFAYSFSALGYRQRRMFWNDPPGDFGGERWLVSGASGGIGRAITEGAVEQGAQILAVARSEAKLAQLTSECGAAVTATLADLSKKNDVDGLLDELANSTSGATIDVLVNNVGVLLNEHQLDDDGHELSFSTNLLNHYRLTRGLAERDLLADNAVIINMTSGGMYNVPLLINELNVLDAQRYDGVLAYAYQKRAQVVLNTWWREYYADRDWSFYVMHPGWVDTDGVKSSLPQFRALFRHILRDAEAGADTALWLASVRPDQDAADAVWFDRKARDSHLGRATRDCGDTAEALVGLLDSL